MHRLGAHVSLYLGTARVRVRPHFCGRRRKEHAQQQRARSVPALGVRPGDYLLRVLELALDEIFDSFVEERTLYTVELYIRIGSVASVFVENGFNVVTHNTSRKKRGVRASWTRRVVARAPERYDDDDVSVSLSFVFSFVLLVR